MLATLSGSVKVLRFCQVHAYIEAQVKWWEQDISYKKTHSLTSLTCAPCKDNDKFELSKNILWKSGKIHKRVSAAVYYAHYPSLLLLKYVFLPDRFISKFKFNTLNTLFQTHLWRSYPEAMRCETKLCTQLNKSSAPPPPCIVVSYPMTRRKVQILDLLATG